MKVSLSLSPLGGTFERPVENAVARFEERSGWLLLARVAGVCGLGEASPLPGYSDDSLEESERALRGLGPTVEVGMDTLEAFTASVARASDAIPTVAHAARFAFESALFDAYARTRGVPLWAALRHGLELGPPGAHVSGSQLGVAAWIAPDDLRAAEAASAAGVHTFKLKLGRDLDAELAFARKLRDRFPAARLRFDANRSLGASDVDRVLLALAALDAEFCEEPSATLPTGAPVPLALDESLRGVPAADVVPHPGVRAWVLKPTSLGGLLRCAPYVREALRRGIEPIVSHTLEGPVANAVLRELALAIAGGAAAGVGDHAGLHALQPPFAFEAHAGQGDEPVIPHHAPGCGHFERDLSIAEAAREHPTRLAIDGPSGPLSHAELATRCEAQRRALEQLGWRAGDGLAFIPRLDVDTVVTVFTAVAAGIVLVPLHPRGTPDEHEAIVRESGARWIHQRPSRLPFKRSEDTKRPLPEAPLAILFTSGTSGISKGAVLSRRAFVASAWASRQRSSSLPAGAARPSSATQDAPDVWLASLTPAHVGGLSILLRALVHRGTLVLPASSEFHPATTLDLVRRYGVTQLSLVPTMLARCLDETGSAPPSLRVVLLGGAAADAGLVARARAAGFPIRLTYGMTEACSQIATQRDAGEPGCGRPLRGVEVRARGGVLEVRGPTLFSGYLGQREPLDEDGWFRTGDLGRVDDDGCVHIEGRRQDLIITGGENVYPAEVEARVSAHPAVREAAVIGVHDATWGQRVVAVCVLETRRSTTELASSDARILEPTCAGEDEAPWSDVQALLRDVDVALSGALASFKRPKEYWVVDALPRTSLGKVARAGLAGLADARGTRIVAVSALRRS
ncbi:MAG: AMP-binding protein [Sandaracinaceae bacterium]|nr:AMP-binding protein [Myxococcales bacterium]MCB9657148.1 AMP-binding protein [Sandaracinaceae bacterium]